MGDITLNDIKKLIDDLKKDMNELKTSQDNLKKEIENSNDELKKEIKDLKKESANTNYKLEMLQSKSNKPNNFLDALSPAAAVGSKYHKTNSFYSE